MRFPWEETCSPTEGAEKASPDGRYPAFVSGRQDGRTAGRQDGKGGQVWLLDRRGGEAQRLTTLKGGSRCLPGRRTRSGWCSCSTRRRTRSRGRTRRSTRRRNRASSTDNLKRDVAGYLGTKRTHLALFDVATKKLDSLTSAAYDDDSRSWSPDGQRIAFVRTPIAERGTGRE